MIGSDSFLLTDNATSLKNDRTRRCNESEKATQALTRSRLSGYVVSRRRVDRPVDRPVDLPILFIFFFLNLVFSNLIFVIQTTSDFKSLYMKIDQKNETDAMAQLPYLNSVISTT